MGTGDGREVKGSGITVGMAVTLATVATFPLAFARGTLFPFAPFERFTLPLDGIALA